MKKHFKILLILFVLKFNLISQDKIYFRDSSIIEGKVLEISPFEITYKLFSNINGPTYKIYKHKVEKIMYKNGLEDVFTETINNQTIYNTEIKSDLAPFNKKNILFYNPIELTDGAIGLSYIRVFYKPRLSIYSSIAFNFNNNIPYFSNGILIEENFDYRLNKKNKDACIAINYNFVKRQQSFPFIGLLFRAAEFEGSYRQYTFTLNKYYFYINSGFVIRNNKGFSFMLNFALGHYYNDYTLNNPIDHLNAYYVRTRNLNINSLIFNLQFGYSF